jgi:hypothetical protein
LKLSTKGIKRSTKNYRKTDFLGTSENLAKKIFLGGTSYSNFNVFFNFYIWDRATFFENKISYKIEIVHFIKTLLYNLVSGFQGQIKITRSKVM